MSKKEFKIPFMYCKLERAAKLLNTYISSPIEVEDFLNFAIARNIRLHVYYNSAIVSDFKPFKLELAKLKEYFAFEENGSYTYFKFGYTFEERAISIASSALLANELDADLTEDPNRCAFVKGFWPLNEWDLKAIYFGEDKTSSFQLYSLGGLLMADLPESYLKIERDIRVEDLIIFEHELRKVFEHLTSRKLFETTATEIDQFKAAREAALVEQYPQKAERVTGTVAELIYGLLRLVYKHDVEILRHSSRLYSDLQIKFIKNEPSIEANIMSQRAFEELMNKIHTKIGK